MSQYPPIQGQEDHPLIETTTLSSVKSGLYEEVLAFTVLTEESRALLDRKCTDQGFDFGQTCLRMEIVSSGLGGYIPEGARSSSPSRGACVCTAAFEERAGLASTRGLNHKP